VPFEGDLDDYRKFLLSGDNAPTRPPEPELKHTKEHARRRRGEKRQTLRPLKEASRRRVRSRALQAKSPSWTKAVRSLPVHQKIPPIGSAVSKSAPKQCANWPRSKACGWRRRKNMNLALRRTKTSCLLCSRGNPWFPRIIEQSQVLVGDLSVLVSFPATRGARMSDNRFFRRDGRSHWPLWRKKLAPNCCSRSGRASSSATSRSGTGGKDDIAVFCMSAMPAPSPGAMPASSSPAKSWAITRTMVAPCCWPAIRAWPSPSWPHHFIPPAAPQSSSIPAP